MINMPNAAGFIPNESVLDGIGKLMSLFGPEAKAKRAAELAQTQAQTGLVGANTGLVGAQTTDLPKRTAIAQGGLHNDTERVGLEGRGQALKENSFLNLDLPKMESDLEHTTAINEQIRKGVIPLTQAQTAATTAGVGQKDKELDIAGRAQTGNELYQQGSLGIQRQNADSQAAALAQEYKLKNADLDEKMHERMDRGLQVKHQQLVEILSRVPQLDDNFKRQMLYGLTKEMDPNVAKAMVDSVMMTDEARKRELLDTNKQKLSPHIPGFAPSTAPKLNY